MIISEGDHRITGGNTAARISAIKYRLDVLTASPPLISMIGGQTSKVMFTTITPSEVPITSEHTGIADDATLKLLPPVGLGYDYDNLTSVSGFTLDLLVGQALVDADGDTIRTFGGTAHETLYRILFHELTHLAFVWGGVAPVGIQFEEELAVFAENVIYRPLASGNGWSDATVIRYGHGNGTYNGHGVSGVNSFAVYIAGNNPVTVDATATNVAQATFTAHDAVTTITKTYHNAGFPLGGHQYDHYIELTETTVGTPYVKADTAFTNTLNRIYELSGDMMSSGVSAGVSAATSAWNVMNGLVPGLASIAVTRVRGLGADAWSDDKADHSTLTYDGVVAAGSTARPSVIEIDDHGTVASTLLLGAAGYAASGRDLLRGGSGNDIIIAAGTIDNEVHGNDGRDILIGAIGVDHMFGDAGDDILISSGGANQYDGGTGTDTLYYRAETHGIVVYDWLGQVEHDSGIGTGRTIDTFTSVEGFIGTSSADIFVGDGQGHSFFGGQGEDTYYAGIGGDRFIDDYTYNQSANSINFSGLATGINLTTNSVRQGGTTKDGVYFEGIGKIRGTEQADIFHMEVGDGANNYVWGGGGSDEFYIGIYTRSAYGEAGDDHFYITKLNSASSVYGGTGATGPENDVLDFSKLATAQTIVVNLATGTFTGTASGNNNFSGIESFVFGAIPMQMIGTAGDDVLSTGSGNSYINAGYGDDHITVTPVDAWTPANQRTNASVTINAEQDDDTVIVNRAAQIYGGGGDDCIHLQAGGSIAYGGADDDHIYGSEFRDIVSGDAGDDEIRGNGGNDYIAGMTGHDIIDGGAGIDLYVITGNGATTSTTFTFILGGAEGPVLRVVAGVNSADITNVEHLQFFGTSFNFDIGEALIAMTADGVTTMTGDVLEASLKAHGYATRTQWQQPADSPPAAARAGVGGDHSDADFGASPIGHEPGITDWIDWDALFTNTGVNDTDTPTFLLDDLARQGDVPPESAAPNVFAQSGEDTFYHDYAYADMLMTMPHLQAPMLSEVFLM